MTFPDFGRPQPTLTISGAQASGSAGCNTYAGRLDRNAAGVRFSGQVTEMACAPEVMAVESGFLSALDSARQAQRLGDVLSFTDAAGDTVLQFALNAPAPDLSGQGWVMLDPPWGAEAPSLRIDGERASGWTGCNRWFAGVRQTGNALSFEAIGMTKMACAGAAHALEQRFVSAIERTAGVRVVDDQLELLDAAGAVVLRFGAEDKEIR